MENITFCFITHMYTYIAASVSSFPKCVQIFEVRRVLCPLCKVIPIMQTVAKLHVLNRIKVQERWKSFIFPQFRNYMQDM